MNKICTSIEQSQKLIELGIDINTADMHFVMVDTNTKKYSVGLGHYIGVLPSVSCWSLTALLAHMPCAELYSSADNHYRCFWRYRSSNWFDDPIDACVELLEKVKYEENEIKQEYGD